MKKKAEYVELPPAQFDRVVREMDTTKMRVQLLAWTLKQLGRVKVSDFAYRLGVHLVLGETYTGEPCYKTMETLAKELHKSASAVRRARRELVEHGLTKERPQDMEPPPNGIDPRYTPVTIYVIWHNQYGAPYSEHEVEMLLGAPESFRGVKNDSPKELRAVKNDRAGENDSKAVNSLFNNTNVLLNAREQKTFPAQMALELVGLQDSERDANTPPVPSPSELDAQRPSEELLFQMINANRVAQGKRKQRARFATLEQRQEYESLAQPYGSLEALKPALTRAFARGVYTVKDLLPVLRAQASPKRFNGHAQHPAPQPRKVATAEDAEKAIAASQALKQSDEFKRLYAEMDANMRKRAGVSG